MRAALALLLVLPLLAGCVSDDDQAVQPNPEPQRAPDWAARAIFLGADPADTDGFPDHDHHNRTLHKGVSTPNFEVVGHAASDSAYYQGNAPGTGYCGDVSQHNGTSRQLAVSHSLLSDVGLSVYDVADRTAPVLLGELVLPLAFTYDAAIFEDGRYAVIAANPDAGLEQDPAVPPVPLTMSWRDACTGTERPVGSNVDYTPYGYSAILVDLADPSNPTVADFYEYPGGRNVHSISATTIDGIRYVATSGLGAVPCTVPSVPGLPQPPPPVPPVAAPPCPNMVQVPRYGNLLSHYDFLTVEETASAPDARLQARLVPFAVYTPSDQTHIDPSLLYLSNGHTDATLQKHPVTGQVIGYLADWDGGLHTIRLQKAAAEVPDGLPGQAIPLGSWGAAPGDDPTQNRGNIHSAKPIAGLRDGHHYTLTGQEVVGRPGGRPTGQIVLLDTTNPAVPYPKARWTLPIDVQWPGSLGLAFSTHYPILVEDTLFVAMYHGGVWAADASQENWPDLPSLGVFIPDADVVGTPAHASLAPEVLEVLDLGDGHLLVFDGDSGAYVVKFTGRHPDVPPAMAWDETIGFIG
ncbi:MAG: hypothetical protein QOD77_1418 [Thermoplasmata archaeon]|jgi:hypothetical protein|nr:hypothetical protein [Thermoplasmata archaeon]